MPVRRRRLRHHPLLIALLATALAAANGLLADAAAAAGPRFRDVTAASGLPTIEETSWGAAIADVNGDGWADVFLNRHTKLPSLQLGGAAGFTAAAVNWPQPMDRHNCAWGEANGDGRPDLFCAQGADQGQGANPNELWLNLPGGWQNAAEAYGVAKPEARARTSTWLDYDRDGDLDIFLGSLRRTGYPDVMFRNDRGVFTEVVVGVEGVRNTERATWADWNADGYPDLLLTTGGSPALAFENRSGTFVQVAMPGQGTRNWVTSAWGDYNGDGRPDLALINYAELRILRNDGGGSFTNVRAVSLANGWSVTWVDLNNDGRLDLYVVQTAPTGDPGSRPDVADLLLMQTKYATFDVVRPAVLKGWPGSGESSAVLDYDRDGRMDVLVSNGRVRWPGPARLLRNTLVAGKAAAIRLRGPAWNPLGMGALVRLQTPKFSYQRQLNDGVAGTSQSDVSYVHLGLRQQDAGQVRVTWPDGTLDCLRVTAGSVTELPIGSSPCR